MKNKNIIYEIVIDSNNREMINESALDDIKNLLRKFKEKSNKTKEDKKKEKRLKKKADKKRKGSKKVRKTTNGGKMYYDYDDYESKNRKVSKGDADSIIDTIDQTNTNIAAIGKTVLPKHTDEGAQSQLRKILNRERPMTKTIASKLEKLISRGKIAVK